MPPEATTPSRPVITVVCVGKVYLAGRKVGLRFQEVTHEGSLAAERIYDHKGLRHVRVGAVYQVEVDPTNEGTIYLNTLRWVRLWENLEEASLWQLAADAFDTRHLAAQQERKQNARRLPLERLAPIRNVYSKTNALGRLAIEVRVLAYLRQVTVRAPD